MTYNFHDKPFLNLTKQLMLASEILQSKTCIETFASQGLTCSKNGLAGGSVSCLNRRAEESQEVWKRKLREFHYSFSRQLGLYFHHAPTTPSDTKAEIGFNYKIALLNIIITITTTFFPHSSDYRYWTGYYGLPVAGWNAGNDGQDYLNIEG